MTALMGILTSITNDRIIPKKIRGNAFLSTLFMF